MHIGSHPCSQITLHWRLNEPSHEIMVLFVLCKLILQTCMCSHPVGLHVWFLLHLIYFHTSCVRAAMALVRLRKCAGSPEPLLVMKSKDWTDCAGCTYFCRFFSCSSSIGIDLHLIVYNLWNEKQVLKYKLKLNVFIISPEPKAHWWAYMIGRPPSSICLLSTLFKDLLRKTTWPIEAKFHNGVSMGWRNKSLFKRPVTWPRLPPYPYMVKTLKNFLRNQKADDLETCYAASGAQVLPSLFKWPWVDFDLFQGKVKFGPLCFCMGKKVN